MRRIVTLAAIIGIVAVSVLGGVLPAQAASVPPVVMPGCNGSAGIDPPERGGWIGGRDVTATGTPATDPAPVRARTARLGEPCWDEGTLSMPIQVTDIPAEKLDADEDGEDDGGPDGGCEETPTSSGTGLLSPAFVYCNEGLLTTSYTNGGTVTNSPGTVADVVPFEVTAVTPPAGATPGSITLDIEDAFTSDAQWKSGRLDLICRHTGTLTRALGGAFSTGTYITTSPTGLTPVISCIGSNYEPLALVSNRYISGTNDRLGYIAWHATDDPAPSDVGTGYWGGTQEAPIMFAPLVGVDYYGETTDQRSVVYCSTSYEGAPTLDFTMMPIIIKGGFGYNPPPGNDPVTPEWSVNLVLFPAVESPTFVTADCPYIHSISLMMCTWSGNGPTTGACAQYLWDAEAWRTHSGYTGSDGEPPGTLLCEVFPATPGCYDVLNPPYVDGTDFDQVCADGPEFVAPGWANFSDWIPDLLEWFGASVGHYAECLFIPINGWDRDGLVESSWQDSPIGQMNDIVSGAFTDISEMTGTCGQILDVDIMGTPMAIDTCTWTWAVPLREMLTWTFLVLGGFGIASFLISTTLSLIKSPAPNPLDEGKK